MCEVAIAALPASQVKSTKLNHLTYGKAIAVHVADFNYKTNIVSFLHD